MERNQRVNTKEKELEVAKSVLVLGTGYWNGKIRERKATFSKLNEALNLIYSSKISLYFEIPARFRDWGGSWESYYAPIEDKIVIKGRLSLVTFLHEWGHVLGFGEVEAQDYAIRIFKVAFPDKYLKLKPVAKGGKVLLVREEKREREERARKVAEESYTVKECITCGDTFASNDSPVCHSTCRACEEANGFGNEEEEGV